jgi:hypothetical protein
LKITCSNNYDKTASAFSVTSDAAADTSTLLFILSGDFSESYNSAGNNINFVLSRSYSTAIVASYVAVAGSNFGSIGGTLTVAVNGSAVGSVVFAAGTPNNVVLFHFAENVAVTNITLTFVKLRVQDMVIITYVAAGATLTLGSQNSEPGGYMRPWMTDSRKTRAVINSAGAPVAYLREGYSQKMSLKLANVANSILDSQSWLDFNNAVYNVGSFFIKERDGSVLADNPRSCYLCFDADVKVTAHNATRALNNLQIQFSAYTGH